MDATDIKPSKKRRQSEDPEAAAKRRQKKQKKTPLSAEIIPPDTSDVESAPSSPSPVAKAKKDKASKAAAAGIPASQQSILDPVEISLTPPPDTQDKKKSKKKKKRDAAEELGAPTTTNGASTSRVEAGDRAESATKVKKEKKDKKKKKKHDDADAGADVADADEKKTKKEKKDKKKTKKDRDADANEDAKREASADLGSQPAPAAQNGVDETSVSELPTTTPEKRRRRKDKSLEIQATPPPESPKAAASTTTDRSSTPSVQTDAPHTKTYSSADADSEPAGPPPIINQEVARWIPLWPRGWDQPITAAIEQHLTPKLHRYDSEIGGVLLSFKNVCLNDKPTREGAATSDEESVKLLSVNEYGVGYCWLIADLELFVPKRGAWMEGELILQNQGHVGVVCWGKFNASIEAKRLPPKWYWVAAPEEDSDVNMEDINAEDGEEHHSATVLGHWVDEGGNRIYGNLRFRIKNYDVGLSGDHSYLCIEGTMLSENEENRLRERELKRANLGSTGGSLRRRQRQLPEFSMTDLGVDADAEKKKSDWGVRTPKKRERREKSSEGAAEAMSVDVEE